MPNDPIQDPALEPGGGSPTPDPSPTPAPDPAPEPEDWEKRFKGMQAAYQSKDGEHKTALATIATLTQESQDKDAEIEALKTQNQDARTALETATKGDEEQQKVVAELTAKTGVQDLILTEFLDLAPIAPLIVETVKGIEDTDQQRTTLQDWQKRMSGYIDNQVETGVNKALRGVTPATSPARTQNPAMGMNDEQLAARLEQIAGLPGKEEETAVLSAEYYRRQEKQKQGA